MELLDPLPHLAVGINLVYLAVPMMGFRKFGHFIFALIAVSCCDSHTVTHGGVTTATHIGVTHGCPIHTYIAHLCKFRVLWASGSHPLRSLGVTPWCIFRDILPRRFASDD